MTRGLWGREGIERKRGFFLRARPGAVVKDKTVAVGGKHKRDIEGHRIVEGLLHSVADAVVVVLCLDDGDRDIGLVIKDVIGALGLATGDELAADDDAPLGESTSSRICIIPSQPARFTAGPMNLEQMSRSLRSFLFNGCWLSL